MRLSVTSTTGIPVELTVPRGETVEGLRSRISEKLQVQTDKIVLLHKNRPLTAGRLLDQDVADGSKLTLVPVIEAGLVCSTSRAERTVMDMLESLTEVQISDFLSGCAPLTIKLRVGSHTMYVQLQLSAQDVELQTDPDSKDQRDSNKRQSGLPNVSSTAPPLLNKTDSHSSPTAPTSSRVPHSSLCTPPMLSKSQRPLKTATNSNYLPSSSHHSAHTPSHIPSSHSPFGCPYPSCPRKGSTPVSTPDLTGPCTGPPSPVPASTFKESGVHPSPPGTCKKPGAVIESFVSHSPGVFSGTFSGTLAPCIQSSHPRNGVAIILQILNDLLRAASFQQGASSALLHWPASNSPVPKEEPCRTATQGTQQLEDTSDKEGHHIPSSTEENQTLHCKLEHLQFLMDQRRLRRQTRRSSHPSKTSHPYQRCHNCP